MKRFLGVLLASTAFSALAAAPSFAIVVESEPNDTFATANSESAGGDIFGSLCANTGAGCSPTDTKDFFVFNGLNPGDSFDFLVQPNFVPITMKFALFTDDTTFTDEVDVTGGNIQHILGTVPVGGSLTLGVSTDDTNPFFEGYRINLSVTAAESVPEPASAVLLAAGLGGMAALRRRRR